MNQAEYEKQIDLKNNQEQRIEKQHKEEVQLSSSMSKKTLLKFSRLHKLPKKTRHLQRSSHKRSSGAF